MVNRERLRRLDETCSAGYDPEDPASAAQFLRVDTEFHVTVTQDSGNNRPASVVAQVFRETERICHGGLRLRNASEEMAHGHRDLVDALVAADFEGEQRVVAAQIEAAHKIVMDGLDSSPESATASLVG